MKTLEEQRTESVLKMQERIAKLEKENAELRKVAEFQQSSNINKYFENKKLKEGLAVGSTWNKHLNSLNKELEEQIEKMKYALNKIIKTVHNDNISGYGDRLVIIYDISCEVLQELEK